MDTQEYSDEQLNFFRLCHIFTNEVAGSLRLFFKQQWDRRYKEKWKDGREYGQKFKRRETGENQKINKENLKIMVKGNTAEWDCTKLFYAICYSNCIGRRLRTAHKKALEKLRKARNKFYAHVPRGMIKSAEFEFIVKEIENALLNLGLSTRKIQVIREQKSFPTKALNKALAKVKSLEQEVKVLEAQLNKDVSSFCVLPPKPFHDVVDRDREVAKIAKQLEELKEANENRLSYLYISGNPGSGKSQLAGLVAKRLFNEDTQIPSTASFVMTIDAKTPSTILKSYVDLARELKCPEYSITKTLDSPRLNSKTKKIANLKSLIGSKIELYTTWLLVVDNVESISKINAYLPASGNEKWARGQLLITTQDTEHIPSVSSFVNHVSVSKGMEANDAVHLLKKVSGCSGYEREEVAQRLDYQPLALAKAAAYVRGVRDIEGGANFGWSDYLKKLKEGRTVASEKIVVDPVYPQSMGEVTRIAVKEAIKSTNVIIKNVFTLLFFCAPQPLSLEIVTNYIRNVAEEMGDKNAIRLQIQRCSLLLFHQEKNALFIKTHQVVHDAIRAVLKDYLKYDKLGAMKAAFMSFYQFVEDTQRDHLSFLDTFAKHSQCIPHIESLTTQIKDIFSVEETRNRVKIMFESDARCLETLGTICEEHFADQAAEDCFDIFLKIRPENLSPDDLDVGMAYSSLGGAQINLQEYEKAKESLDSALKIFKKLRPGDVIVGVTYSSLGDAHQILCDSIPAKQCYRRALSIFEKELTPDNYIVGETCSSLGNVLKDLGELNQAKENYDRALPILLKKLRPGHAEVGMTYKNLGDVHYDLAFPTLQKELGPESYVVGETLMELGKVLTDPSELNQAKESYELALPILLREWGPEDCWIKMIKDRLVKIKQLQENFPRSSGSFGKRPNCSGHLGLVPAKRSKKK